VEGLAGDPFQLGHDVVQERVDLVHLVAAEGRLEPGLLDLLGGEGRLVVGALGGRAVSQPGQVGGGPLQQPPHLAPPVAAHDPGEGPRPDLLGREPAFGHGASYPMTSAVMATSSVLLDPAAWQTGTVPAEPVKNQRVDVPVFVGAARIPHQQAPKTENDTLFPYGFARAGDAGP
jgi:hypothetical protein